MKDPFELQISTMFKSIGMGISILLLMLAFTYGSLSLLDSHTSNTTESGFNAFLENTTSNTTVFYQNITVIDKEHRERSFRGDVYNVVYETETGDIQKDNNMTLYYQVEEGLSYNVSGKYEIRGIVGEV